MAASALVRSIPHRQFQLDAVSIVREFWPPRPLTGPRPLFAESGGLTGTLSQFQGAGPCGDAASSLPDLACGSGTSHDKLPPPPATEIVSDDAAELASPGTTMSRLRCRTRSMSIVVEPV